MENKIKKQYTAEIILLFVSFNWGLSFPIIKSGLADSSPFLFVAVRFILTLLFTCFIFYGKIKNINTGNLKYGFYLGILLFIGFITQTTGLNYTTASNSAFITGTNIVMIPFIQYLIVRKKTNIENAIGIIVVTFGLFLLTGIKDLRMNFGDMLTLICALSFAFYIVILDKFSARTDTFELVIGQFLFTAVVSTVTAVFFEGFIYKDIRFNITGTLIFAILFTSVINTTLGLYLSTTYQKFTTPVRAGLIYNTEQIFAVISAYLILGELLGTTQIAGVLIMLAGILISEFGGFILKKNKNAGNI